MEFLSVIFLLAGYVLLGLYSYQVWRGLSARFPFGQKSRWWWTKYMPIMGMGFLLMAAGEPLLLNLPGLTVIIGNGIWLAYCESHNIRSEPW